MPLTSLRFRGLLTITFATAMLSILICGIVEYWGMVRLDRATIDIRHGEGALAAAADDMREDVLELRRYEKDVFMNVGSEAQVREYRAKWDGAFADFRHDLVRARRAGPTSQDAQLQQITDRISAYEAAFVGIYDSIANGTIRSTQQANDQLIPVKDSVRGAEITLEKIGDSAPNRIPLLSSAVIAQRFGFAVSCVLFLALAVLFVGYRRLPAVSYA